MEGTIKKAFERGFFFIAPSDGGADMFLHIKDVVDRHNVDLMIGDRIEYDVAEGKDLRPKAVNARLIGDGD